MSQAISPSKITNISESSNGTPGLADRVISDALGLADIISVRYTKIPSGYEQQYKVEEKKNLICYIINGCGQLKTGEQVAELNPTDCFSFPPLETESSFTLAAGQSPMDVLVVSDVQPDGTSSSVFTPKFPTIVSAEKAAAWRNKGIDCTKAIRLAKATDMGLGRQDGPPWGLTLERIPPGTQSSNAHAHSAEHEFALIIEGKARYWHQGETPERILVQGDAVGWKAGTGICHTLLNDAEDGHGRGEDLVFLVWGADLAHDKLHYATTSPYWWTPERRWLECPIFPIGPAPSLPRHPRPANRPYPS